ncbi:MAG: hypothetical protein QF829_04685, partial [Candidatus Hydrothermarchaeota archaeon]|nr:hypothetical protein [Candidatus Hydrothermarchaeota archaeon]
LEVCDMQKLEPYIPKLFKRLIIQGEAIENVKRDVVGFKKNFKEVKYCFESRDAYKYFEFS